MNSGQAMGSLPSVLVFTPTPTHAPVQGNRRRVFDFCRALQTVGAELTILYYATESITPTESQQMREAWGNLEIVSPCGFIPRQSLVRYPAIDDWYDEAISEAVEELCKHRQFDVCIVNYVWYSRLFQALPPKVVRVIDTHDVFGGRAERFAELGLAAEWFHTSVAQESEGLDRSDFVIAIQDAEAVPLQARTSARVKTVGFLSAPDFLPDTTLGAARRLRVGYIGSGNPFNLSSLLSFARAVEAIPQSLEAIEFHVAGQIGEALAKTSHPFILHGRTASVRDFYKSVDVAINPMTGGTGLKIKSLEALSFGKPLVASREAMTGIPSRNRGHQLEGPKQIVEWLIGLADNPSRLVEEGALSRDVFRTYRKAQLDSFRELWSQVRDEMNVRRRAEVPEGVSR